MPYLMLMAFQRKALMTLTTLKGVNKVDLWTRIENGRLDRKLGKDFAEKPQL